MHLKAGLPFVVLLAFCWVPTTGRAAEPTAAGLWEKRDSSGQPQGWFRIADRNGAYEGQIVRMFAKPGQDPAAPPSPARDERPVRYQRETPVRIGPSCGGRQRPRIQRDRGLDFPREQSVH